jgi:hypothetical protein
VWYQKEHGYTSYAHAKIKESVPYADVIIGILESDTEENKLGDSRNMTHGLANDKIISIKELELTIRSNNIKHLPTYHKFRELMDDVIDYFKKDTSSYYLLSE